MIEHAERSEILFTAPVDALATLIEEVTRANTDSARRFIEPARGTLERAKSKRHHLIFGRRGSGKTSLLRKALADLALNRCPAAFVDLEAFKTHSYPDVLLSVLIETFRTFDNWLSTAGSAPSTKTSFWKELFGSKPKVPPLSKQGVLALRAKLSAHVQSLEEILHASDGAVIQKIETLGSENATTVDGKASLGFGVEIAGKHAEKANTSTELKEEGRRSKIDYLLRHILDFQQTFQKMSEVSNGPAYVFLDDLYFIKKKDQADVLDYFHRIAKGRAVWLKAGSIRHRTEWYHHGDPPVGLKLGDDADDIDLDLTLEKFTLARQFLVSILDQLVKEVGLVGHSKIISPGGVERLVLASGGVARDFLTILRRSIDVARERREAGNDSRGPRITAEDVNAAAGEHDPSKRDEMKRDTLEERAALEAALTNVQQFCIDQEINCFLIEQGTETAGSKLLRELVDLRFVHLVKSRVTVREKKGVLFSAYMLDVSQYTGSRKRRELQMVNFWEAEALDRLRQPRFILPAEKIEARVSEQEAANPTANVAAVRRVRPKVIQRKKK